MPAGISQNDWDNMTLEERKRELEKRGYVEGLVIQSEVGEAWWGRFSERLTILSQESLWVNIPELTLETLPFYVFSAIQKNSTSEMKREIDATGRARNLIVETISWPDVCADLALFAYKIKGELVGSHEKKIADFTSAVQS